jgi:hypothetical protein
MHDSKVCENGSDMKNLSPESMFENASKHNPSIKFSGFFDKTNLSKSKTNHASSYY